MKTFVSAALCLLLIIGSVPARADFKYTDTSKITGGSLKSMMKFAGVFSKQASQAMKPMSSTRYVKGNLMRSDDADGSIQIIDLDQKLIIQIDPQNRTYSQATFDEIRDALKKATEEQRQKMQKDPKTKDTQVNMNAKISATPGTTGRMINGQSTNEMKIQIEMEVTAQQQPDGQPQPQPSGPVSGTMATSIDSWIAPSVSGYEEVGKFYTKMAKELNWVPPTGITMNPQVSQGMQELQKNQSMYKGLPMLQYVSMAMAGGQGAEASQQSQESRSSTTSSSTASNDPPTSASQAMVKGLGGLFGKKKKKDDAPASDSNSGSTSLNPPPPPSVPGSLIEMTIEVTSFSDSRLDATLFAVPAGYTKVTSDPNRIFGKPAKH
jgi:hypothetical protein